MILMVPSKPFQCVISPIPTVQTERGEEKKLKTGINLQGSQSRASILPAVRIDAGQIPQGSSLLPFAQVKHGRAQKEHSALPALEFLYLTACQEYQDVCGEREEGWEGRGRAAFLPRRGAQGAGPAKSECL